MLELYTGGVTLVTGRVAARAAIPEVLRLLAGADLRRSCNVSGVSTAMVNKFVRDLDVVRPSAQRRVVP